MTKHIAVTGISMERTCLYKQFGKEYPGYRVHISLPKDGVYTVTLTKRNVLEKIKDFLGIS